MSLANVIEQRVLEGRLTAAEASQHIIAQRSEQLVMSVRKEIARVFDELFGKHADWLLSQTPGACQEYPPKKSRCGQNSGCSSELFSDDDLECYERKVSAGKKARHLGIGFQQQNTPAQSFIWTAHATIGSRDTIAEGQREVQLAIRVQPHASQISRNKIRTGGHE